MRQSRALRQGLDRAWRIALIAIVGIAPFVAHAGDLARGDTAWASRAEGERDGRLVPARIFDAVEFYEGAIASDPEHLEARWKLLRALHFAGDFAAHDGEERRSIFDRARRVAEDGIDRLADRVGAGTPLAESRPEVVRGLLEAGNVPQQDVARLYFWAAINWGAWSRDVGLVEAVRSGVADRLHQYTRVTIALEPDYDEGGALRFLSQLHAELPRVPFVTGWVDRSRALPLIEQAYELAPENPGNCLLLALTLVALAPERRSEALDLLDQVGQLDPRPSMRIEDIAMRQQARERLAAIRAGSA